MDYKPSDTCREFMLDDSLVKVIVGPLGSGKSFAAIMELFRRACEQAPDSMGVRPTRFVVVRNTLQQLRETFLADTEQYLQQFFNYKVSTNTLQFRFGLPDGTRVVSDWLLMPLERPEDSRKLLSLNITSALIEECREVDYDTVAALMGRLGRYPSKARISPTWQALVCVSNPWSEGSAWHEHLYINRPDGWALFRQPGGLDIDAENVENLPDGYYDRLMDGHSDEWIKVHVHGQWGDDQYGQAVYRAAFERDFHVWNKSRRWEANMHRPLLVGIDFGRTPACVITQESVEGTVQIFEEITTEDMNLRQFCEELLLPRLNEYYGACRVFIVGDPAGTARSAYTEETAFSVLKEYGLDAIPAPTNAPDQRLRAVEKLLLDQRGGKPRMLIHGELCPVLVAGFLRDYRYRKKRDGELNPTPEKNSASHVHDAMQYAALGVQSNYVGKRLEMRARQHLATQTRKRFSPRAWT